MPAGDRTGPAGRGPITGRGAGYCAGYYAPGYTNPWSGRGRMAGPGWRWGGGRGAGFGWGWRRGTGWGFPGSGVPYREWNYSDAVAGDEQQWLKEEIDSLESELERLRTRLKEMEDSDSHED